MAHAGPTTLPLEQAYPPGRNASKCMFMGPDGEVQEQYSAPPVREAMLCICALKASSFVDTRGVRNRCCLSLPRADHT